ncbi:MAG TPA: hypothetical protein VEJ63_21955 [Planctomycetota bacterium]|nr:hypothetical protein [Planctomycetota bacterium]
MVIGNQTHKYEVAEGWGKLPAGIKYGYTHGAVVDKQDRVFIHNQSKDAVIIFDRDGNFIKSWGKDFEQGAHGMYLSNEGGKEYLYLSDYVRHIVVKTTLEGEVIYQLEMPNRPDIYASKDEYKPTETCVAPNGDVYVTDGYGKSWIHRYDKHGKYIGSFGGPKGSEPGQTACPHGVRVIQRNGATELYCADRSNNRIQVFTLDGKHIRFVKDELRYPCCFYQYKDEIYIPDLHSRITIFDKNDKLITHLGDTPDGWKKPGWPNIPQEELKVGYFSSPHNLCVDSRGDIYVAEWIAVGRVTKLVRQR